MAAGFQCVAANRGLARYGKCGDVGGVKCSTSNARHTVSNRHIRKTAAVVERPPPDFCNAVRNRHARKTATLSKRRRTDARHAVANCHTRQFVAV